MHTLPAGGAVLAGNVVPGVQECSERSGRSERSARAEQCSERKSRFWVFRQLAKRLCPSELYRDSVQGGAAGLKKLLYSCRNSSRWDKTDVRGRPGFLPHLYLAWRRQA